MKSFLLPVLLAALVLMACGSEDSTEEASPLSVIPERAMISIVLTDPAEMVRNIDGYIEDGAPVLGENLLENLICEQLAVSCMDSMPSRYGFDPSGEVVFWMESTMPQSMGMAVSAPDFQLFLSLLEEMGAELVDEEPILGETVYSINTGEDSKYLAGVRGVVLVASSGAKLEALMQGLAPVTSDEVATASLAIKINLSMIGPMAVAQMPMARMMMMQGMAADTTMPSFVPAVMEVYLDGIELFLTQADMMEFTLVTESENFVLRKKVSFIDGSSIGEMLVSSPETDMVQYLTQGDVATVRFQMPSEIAFYITRAFTEVFTGEISDEVLRFWSSMVSNGAVSIYSDDFMHMVAAYEVSGDATTEEIAVQYSDYLGTIMPFLEQNDDLANTFSIQDNGIVRIDGVDFYSMSMSIQPDTTLAMNFDYWLTVHDGALLLETSPQPEILLSIVSGDYIPAELEESGNLAGEMSLVGYINLIMAISPQGMDIPEIGSDVIFNWDGDYAEGEIYGEMSMDGSDAVAAGFAYYELISAMEE